MVGKEEIRKRRFRGKRVAGKEGEKLAGRRKKKRKRKAERNSIGQKQREKLRVVVGF